MNSSLIYTCVLHIALFPGACSKNRIFSSECLEMRLEHYSVAVVPYGIFSNKMHDPI